MAHTTRRNGKIELLRFVFCIFILLYHCKRYLLPDIGLKYIRLYLMPHGMLGVEFFFIVSGYLMARTAVRRQETEGSPVALGEETRSFLWRKLKPILPYHLVSFVFALVSFLWMSGYGKKKAFFYVINAIPSLALLEMLGIKCSYPNHPEWYLSVMFFVMPMFYPLLRKYYSMFVNVLAPVLALGLLGWLSYTYGCVTEVTEWTGIAYKCMFRGMADLALGAVAFEITRHLTALHLTSRQRFWLSALEGICFLGVFVYMLFTFEKRYEIYCVFAIMAVVVLAFSGQTYGTQALSNPVCQALGRFSMPVYLTQASGIYITQKVASDWSYAAQVVFCVSCTLVLSLICLAAGDFLMELLFPQKRSLG